MKKIWVFTVVLTSAMWLTWNLQASPAPALQPLPILNSFLPIEISIQETPQPEPYYLPVIAHNVLSKADGFTNHWNKQYHIQRNIHTSA